MHVIATAGHVDHGKSTLVQALTGMDPDRLEEEHRRGLSILLGYCWTRFPGVGDVAFVDVPGHERFISTMLSGIGPVPAVLFVVAADDPWMPQAAEHLAALDALAVSRGVVAVTRSDLADPEPAAARAAAELESTSLRGSPIVQVSGRTGVGLDELRTAVVAMVRGLPNPDPGSDVRLWVDRRFTIRGAGTVATGTLPAGTISRGDTLALVTKAVRVRGVQSLGAPVDRAQGSARVALNLTGELDGLERGSVLVTPDSWHFTSVVDVRLTRSRSGLPSQPLLHIGATSVGVRARPFSDELVRLTLERALPLRIGDRALVRDPGSRQVWGAVVLDPAPPALQRRGAGADRAAALASLSGQPDLASELARRETAHTDLLRRIGVRVPSVAGRWVMSEARAARAADDVEQAVKEHDRESPLDPGVPLGVLAERVGLPSADLVAAVVRPPLRLANGRVSAAESALPERLESALDRLRADLADNPFAAPTAERLHDLGLDNRAVAAAARAQRLLRLAPHVVVLPDAVDTAVDWLGDLPQPFTTSHARTRLGTSRRVVLPLLEHLDRLGLTERLPDDSRRVRPPAT